MESEFQILNNIGSNENVTQRDIARDTGMSLGNVNTLIKRLVKKGLVKVEKLTPRSIKYILTPKGIKEKAERTYKYIVSSYKYFAEVNSKIDIIISRYLEDTSLPKQAILFGRKDEIYELLNVKFHHIKKTFTLLDNETQIRLIPKDSIVFAWHPDYFEILESNKVPYINILETSLK